MMTTIKGGGCCVIGFFFSYFMVPETKGLSLEQVDLLYRNSSIRKSNEYRQKIIDENLHELAHTAAGSEVEKVEEKDTQTEEVKVSL